MIDNIIEIFKEYLTDKGYGYINPPTKEYIKERLNEKNNTNNKTV